MILEIRDSEQGKEDEICGYGDDYHFSSRLQRILGDSHSVSSFKCPNPEIRVQRKCLVSFVKEVTSIPVDHRLHFSPAGDGSNVLG